MNNSEQMKDSNIELTVGYATDRGLKRQLNEDSLIASEPIFAVADGMGGHEAGEVASGICVRTLAESSIIGEHAPHFSAADLEELLHTADEHIRSETGGRAGTTLSGVVLVEESGMPYWLFFNVGDSRTYRLSQGRFGQISVDHSEVQELVDRGHITQEQAVGHPRRHVITRALGTGDDSEADYWLMPVEVDDRILICSDGLSTEVSDDRIYTLLSSTADPQQTADALVQETLRNGARDNVTVVVVDARGVDGDADLHVTAPRTIGADTAAAAAEVSAAEAPAAEVPSAEAERP
ncbi:protein phosphatase 2C domain-containing protein [Arthrobacter tumbae]|uniref:PP2C family protein-serine/threonine phosphatase n=1 Tax=Arthrobacter tumbae TaxID=163874 RepID=UPI001958D1C1|nr:protein phosphatase 2C domain-containing protein [Arthrobacter tumbae]MBM7782623.1 protein phosphatase [Arthrobacter tumbae]